MSQDEPVGASRSKQEPGGQEAGGARRSQEGARRSQEEPDAPLARRSQEEPGGASIACSKGLLPGHMYISF